MPFNVSPDQIVRFPISTINDVPDMSEGERREFWREHREQSVWNQRAALLRALQDETLTEAKRVVLDFRIQQLNEWFQLEAWQQDTSQLGGLQVTPLPSPQEIRALAMANSAAAQDVASTALAVDLIRLATRFIN